MDVNAFLLVSGCIFGLVSLVQVARLAFRWPVRIASVEIPLAASWIALPIAAGLCVWALSLASL